MPETGNAAITVKQFLATAEQHLRIGDIILSRSPTFTSWLIRFATGSQFSHAALVFVVSKPDDGFNNTFLLESISTGVGLANLRDYIGGRQPQAEIVVLRLDGEGLDEAYFKKVRGLMLDHVKSGYDFSRVMRLGLAAAFGMRLGWSKISKGPRRSMQDAIRRTRMRLHKWVPPQFICSGFIQYGLAKAAELSGLSTDVMLKEGLTRDNKQGILAVTPEDLARSPRLTWRFVIKSGWVRPVSSYDRASRIFNRR
jgi:Permuted papain-like amidase enzyme, YaeF/YiiX, C92 family